MFSYTFDNKRYHTLNYYYQNKFNQKIAKISLNPGFGCPNSKNNNGCIFCKNNSGDFAGNPKDNLTKQFNEIKKIIDQKWPNAKYIGYFQAGTNTYAPVKILKECYETILNQKNVVGLAIATRSDTINKETLKYLEELNKKTFLTIELGLQTTNKKTLKLINRGHTLENFTKCVKKLKEKNINVVVHIINGLPYETKKDMINTVKYLNKLNIDGIKIHMLSILKGTKLEKLYQKEKFKILTKEEYIDIVCEQLRYLNPKIVIHRITQDPNPIDLIEPKWLIKKFTVLNDIDKKMQKENIYQGDLVQKNNISNRKRR